MALFICNQTAVNQLHCLPHSVQYFAPSFSGAPHSVQNLPAVGLGIVGIGAAFFGVAVLGAGDAGFYGAGGGFGIWGGVKLTVPEGAVKSAGISGVPVPR